MIDDPPELPIDSDRPPAALSLRDRAVALVRSVVPSVLGDPDFDVVTQGRADHDPHYSSCADLCHYVLWQLGCRIQGFVNREEPDSGFRWKPGVNVSYLGPFGKGPRLGCWVPYALGKLPNPGDLVLIGDRHKGEQEHMLVPLEFSNNNIWTSGDFGQVSIVDGRSKPSSKIVVRKLEHGLLGGRTPLGWIDLCAVPGLA